MYENEPFEVTVSLRTLDALLSALDVAMEHASHWIESEEDSSEHEHIFELREMIDHWRFDAIKDTK